MLHAFFALLPFMTILFWIFIEIMHWNTYTNAQRAMLPSGICNLILFGCQAYFFLSGVSPWLDIIWAGSLLASYPLLYRAIDKITSTPDKESKLFYIMMLPAVIVPIGMLFLPDEPLLKLKYILFLIIIAIVLVDSIRKLRRFEREIRNSYAETGEKSTLPLRVMLYLMMFTSVCSSIFTSLGRDVIAQDVLIGIPAVLFSIIIFGITYILDRYNFSATILADDNSTTGDDTYTETSDKKEVTPKQSKESIQEARQRDKDFEDRLMKLMLEDKIYLQPNIKIGDLAKLMRSNRTYMSQFINQNMNKSFADFINGYRIDYAKKKFAEQPDITIKALALSSGFATEQSFLLNYQKLTGTKFLKRKA